MELSEEAKELIDDANFGHLATNMSDGSPHVAPVWIGRDDDYLLVGTGAETLKARNTRRDARIALSVLDQRNPYREVQIRGTVVEQRRDESLEIMDGIARKYTGKPFPFRSGKGRIALVIRADRIRFAELPFAHTPS